MSITLFLELRISQAPAAANPTPRLFGCLAQSTRFKDRPHKPPRNRGGGLTTEDTEYTES